MLSGYWISMRINLHTHLPKKIRPIQQIIATSKTDIYKIKMGAGVRKYPAREY